MSTQFNYTYDNFIAGINIEKLRCEIEIAIPGNEFYISAHGNNVSIFFNIGLSGGEITSLNNVIAVHDASIAITNDCISPETYPNIIVDDITVLGNGAAGNIIVVQDESINISNTPHSTLNFIGNGVNVVDGGSGIADITINGSDFILNSLTPQVQFLETGVIGNNFNIMSSGNTHVFNLPEASLTANGIVTTTTQQFNGGKTFTKPITTLEYISCSTNSGTNVSSLTINKPSGAIPSDQLMICYITVRNGFSRTDNSVPYTDTREVLSPPIGWTLINTVSNVVSYPRTVFTYIKTVAIGEPANYTWNDIRPSPAQTFDAQVTASFSGTTMTVTSVSSGTLTTGQTISGTAIPGGITITAFGTGSGGTGTYTISTTLSLSSRTVNATVPKTNFIIGGINLFSGASLYNIIDVLGSQDTAFSLSHSTPLVSTTTVNTLIIAYFSMASVVSSWSIDMGMDQGCSAGTGPAGPSAPQAIGECMVTGYKLESDAGPIGPFTATASSDPDVGITSIIAFRQTTDAIVTILAANGQSTDMFINRDYNGNILSGFNFNGELFIGGGNSTFDSNIITFKTDTLTQDYVIRVPSASTLLVGNDTVDLLSNKTLTDNTNNIISRALWYNNGSNSVSTYAAAAPTTGQILQATSATTATWQNLPAPPTTFVDTTFAIQDIGDNTKTIKFDAAGTTSTSTTLLSSQTVNRVLTLPNASDTLVARTTTDTLTNKTITATTNLIRATELGTTGSSVNIVSAAPPTTGQILQATSATTATWQTPSSGGPTFVDTTFAIQDFTDNTKTIKFDAAGTTSTSTTLLSSQTVNRVLTLPNASDTLVARTTTDTLTNKTITATTNLIRATELGTTGSSVNIASAAPPVTGQILQATSATTATWQRQVVIKTLFAEVTSDTSTTATVGIPSVLLSIATTPESASSSFIIQFDASGYISSGNDAQISFSIYYGLTSGTLTRRRSTYIFSDSTNNESGSCALSMKIAAISAAEHTIQIRWGRTQSTANIDVVSNSEYDHASLIITEVTN